MRRNELEGMARNLERKEKQPKPKVQTLSTLRAFASRWLRVRSYDFQRAPESPAVIGGAYYGGRRECENRYYHSLGMMTVSCATVVVSLSNHHLLTLRQALGERNILTAICKTKY